MPLPPSRSSQLHEDRPQGLAQEHPRVRVGHAGCSAAQASCSSCSLSPAHSPPSPSLLLLPPPLSMGSLVSGLLPYFFHLPCPCSQRVLPNRWHTLFPCLPFFFSLPRISFGFHLFPSYPPVPVPSQLSLQSFLFVFLARDKSIDLKHMGEMVRTFSPSAPHLSYISVSSDIIPITNSRSLSSCSLR